MPLFADFNTPRSICYAVQKAGEPEVGRLVARPWNMYDPDNTAWWLIPSGDWPAYKYGKIHFYWANTEGDSIFVALYFEKGLDPVISSVYSCPKGFRLIMDKDWAWHKLIRDLENGKIQQRVSRLANQLPVPLKLIINGGYVNDPCEYDPYEQQFDSEGEIFPSDEYIFEWKPTSSEFVLKESQLKAQVLEGLTQVVKFEHLPSVLRTFNKNGWLWVNFYLGVTFQIRDNRKLDEVTPTWSAMDMWTNFLCSLSPWLG